MSYIYSTFNLSTDNNKKDLDIRVEKRRIKSKGMEILSMGMGGVVVRDGNYVFVTNSNLKVEEDNTTNNIGKYGICVIQSMPSSIKIQTQGEWLECLDQWLKVMKNLEVIEKKI